MKKYWVILALCVLAFANALYLTSRAYELRALEATQKASTGFQASICDVNDELSCSKVLTHPRAQFFGFPFPAVAMVVYPILAIITILGMTGVFSRAYPTLAIMAVMGASMNGYYITQEILYIKALCPLCLLCTGMILTIFILSCIGWRGQHKSVA